VTGQIGLYVAVYVPWLIAAIISPLILYAIAHLDSSNTKPKHAVRAHRPPTTRQEPET
jgi:hypothetical protein